MPRKGFGAQKKHSQSGALSFACTESVVTVVASKCQPFLKPTSDHRELPPGPRLLRVVKAGALASPSRRSRVRAVRNERLTPLPFGPRNCFLSWI